VKVGFGTTALARRSAYGSVREHVQHIERKRWGKVSPRLGLPVQRRSPNDRIRTTGVCGETGDHRLRQAGKSSSFAEGFASRSTA